MSDLVDALEHVEARAKEGSEALTVAYMSGKYDGKKETEAEVARLNKMVATLSEWCAMFESGHTLEEIGLSLSNGMACPEPWQYVEEAARRAMAESKVKT